MPNVIDEMFAFIAVDEDGDEGIVSCLDLSKQVYAPMIGADMARVESLRPVAQDIANRTGRSIRLVRFHMRADKEWIVPA